eukprot:4466455-Pleurochrysis_carterae.AAC.1
MSSTRNPRTGSAQSGTRTYGRSAFCGGTGRDGRPSSSTAVWVSAGHSRLTASRGCRRSSRRGRRGSSRASTRRSQRRRQLG